MAKVYEARILKGQRESRVQNRDPRGTERRLVHEHLARALAGLVMTKKPKVVV